MRGKGETSKTATNQQEVGEEKKKKKWKKPTTTMTIADEVVGGIEMMKRAPDQQSCGGQTERVRERERAEKKP